MTTGRAPRRTHSEAPESMSGVAISRNAATAVRKAPRSTSAAARARVSSFAPSYRLPWAISRIAVSGRSADAAAISRSCYGTPVWMGYAEVIMIGTQLGRWVIDRQLGKGAMGSVYFAHAADAPDEVRAIKVLAPDLARDETARKRFKQEIDVLCQLDHANIVRFDGSDKEGETSYYVMEYINGPDCETRLRELKRWPWWEV